MHDNVQWLIRSSQKDSESPAFSKLPTKIGEEPILNTRAGKVGAWQLSAFEQRNQK
jgi:hypothetical protein